MSKLLPLEYKNAPCRSSCCPRHPRHCIPSHETTPTSPLASNPSGPGTIPPNHTRAMPSEAALKSLRSAAYNALARARCDDSSARYTCEFSPACTHPLKLTKFTYIRACRALAIAERVTAPCSLPCGCELSKDATQVCSSFSCARSPRLTVSFLHPSGNDLVIRQNEHRESSTRQSAGVASFAAFLAPRSYTPLTSSLLATPHAGTHAPELSSQVLTADRLDSQSGTRSRSASIGRRRGASQCVRIPIRGVPWMDRPH